MTLGRVDDADVTRLALAAKSGDRAAAAEFVRATQHGVYRFLAYPAANTTATSDDGDGRTSRALGLGIAGLVAGLGGLAVGLLGWRRSTT
jgi:hypothetical protein